MVLVATLSQTVIEWKLLVAKTGSFSVAAFQAAPLLKPSSGRVRVKHFAACEVLLCAVSPISHGDFGCG